MDKIIRCEFCDIPAMSGFNESVEKEVDFFVIHHWYEPPDYELHTAIACLDCNVLLVPNRLWCLSDGKNGKYKKWMDHVLPHYLIQRLYIQEYRLKEYEWDMYRKCTLRYTFKVSDYYKSCLNKLYEFPLPLPRSEKIKLSIKSKLLKQIRVLEDYMLSDDDIWLKDDSITDTMGNIRSLINNKISLTNPQLKI